MAFSNYDCGLLAFVFCDAVVGARKGGIYTKMENYLPALYPCCCGRHVVWQVWGFSGIALVDILPHSHADDCVAAADSIKIKQG